MGAWRSVFIVLLLGCQAPSKSQQQEPLISVDVNLVLLHASVHDRRGRDVPTLRQSDFRLYEDGELQEIRLFRREDAPVTLGLIVDHSGSMADKLEDVTVAARTLAQAGNPEDEMLVVNFNERVFPALPVDPHARGLRGVEAAIGSVPAAGETALYDAIVSGLSELAEGHRAKKVLVVISDGGDNASKHRLGDVTRLAEESSVVIYSIGIFDENDAEANPSVLKRLAGETGGEAFFPKEMAQTRGICDHIARDIRSQYTIGFVSGSEKKNGEYRSLRLVAETNGTGKLRVRTRSGYLSAGAEVSH